MRTGFDMLQEPSSPKDVIPDDLKKQLHYLTLQVKLK